MHLEPSTDLELKCMLSKYYWHAVIFLKRKILLISSSVTSRWYNNVWKKFQPLLEKHITFHLKGRNMHWPSIRRLDRYPYVWVKKSLTICANACRFLAVYNMDALEVPVTRRFLVIYITVQKQWFKINIEPLYTSSFLNYRLFWHFYVHSFSIYIDMVYI
jgi:hypothetical protein